MHIDPTPGLISGKLIKQFFTALNPIELFQKKYHFIWKNYRDKESMEKFIRMERWLNDAPDQPRLCLQQFIHHFYQKNKLVKNKMTIDQFKIDLQTLKIPVLNIAASNDTIVPLNASFALKRLIKTDYTEKKLTSGHIGMYVNETECRQLAHTISQWLYVRVS